MQEVAASGACSGPYSVSSLSLGVLYLCRNIVGLCKAMLCRSAQQRFFKLMCVSLKTPTVVEASQKALADGFCVVVGLQSTGVFVSLRLWHNTVRVRGLSHPTVSYLGNVQGKQLWTL